LFLFFFLLLFLILKSFLHLLLLLLHLLELDLRVIEGLREKGKLIRTGRLLRFLSEEVRKRMRAEGGGVEKEEEEERREGGRITLASCSASDNFSDSKVSTFLLSASTF